jgi:mono/diheme cytochrome c family protein
MNEECMKISSTFFVLLAFTAFGFSAPQFALAADDGQKIFTEACGGCHSAKMRPLDNLHLTKELWKDTIERMIDLGAEVPKGKMSELLDYLFRTHGPVGAASGSDKK